MPVSVLAGAAIVPSIYDSMALDPEKATAQHIFLTPLFMFGFLFRASKALCSRRRRRGQNLKSKTNQITKLIYRPRRGFFFFYTSCFISICCSLPLNVV